MKNLSTLQKFKNVYRRDKSLRVATLEVPCHHHVTSHWTCFKWSHSGNCVEQ